MATPSELQVAVDRFVDSTEPKINQFVNGDENTTIDTDAGTVPSMSKAIADFQNDNNYVRHDILQSVPLAGIARFLDNIGFPVYASLALANAGEAQIGVPFYNTTSNRYESTTDIV